MYWKSEGLVLRETEYQDADKLLTVLTRARGLVTLRARGVRSRTSRLKSGCQLLAYSEFTVFEGRSGMMVEEASPVELFLPLRNDIELLSLASYFAQVTEVLSQEDEPNPELLSLCLNGASALCRGKPQKLVKAAFEFRAICLAGYAPMLDGCAVCGNPEPDRFHLSGGVLQCAGCQEPGDPGLRLPVSAGTLAALRYMAGCDGKKLFSFRLGEESLKELAGLTQAYLLTQLERGFFTLDFYQSLLA